MGQLRGIFAFSWGKNGADFPSVKVLSPDSESINMIVSLNHPTRYYITGSGFVKRGCGNSLKKGSEHR